MNYTNYMNITTISRQIKPHMPSEDALFETYFKKFGR